MNIFIWEYVDYVSHNYHDAGGIAVVAPTLEAARKLLPRKECEAHTKEPDAVYTLADKIEEPRCFVFPDAGCC